MGKSFRYNLRRMCIVALLAIKVAAEAEVLNCLCKKVIFALKLSMTVFIESR